MRRMIGPQARMPRPTWHARAAIRCTLPKIRSESRPLRSRSAPRVIKRSMRICSSLHIIRCAKGRWPAPPAIRRMARRRRRSWSRTPSRKRVRPVTPNSEGRFSGSTSRSRRTAPTVTIRTVRRSLRFSRCVRRFSARHVMRAQVTSPSRIRRRACPPAAPVLICSPAVASIVTPRFTDRIARRAVR